MKNIVLHEWQEHCLAAWEMAGHRGIASVATGAGKTVLALAALCRLRAGLLKSEARFLEVRIIVPRLFLAQQWKRDLVRHLQINPSQVGLFCGEVHCDPKLPYVIVSLAEARTDCAVDLARRLLPQARAIFFTERIRQADDLAVRLEALFPGRIGRYHSKLDPAVKQRSLDAFRTGEQCAMICCRALDEGLNVPQTDVGIIVSSGNNARQRIQRLGRLLRKTPDETPKRIFYLYVPGTTEPDALLENFPTPPLLDLSYIETSSGLGSLTNPVYDFLADQVIENLRVNAASPAQIRTAKTQLARGLLASDWLLDEADCLALLARASRFQKPYLQVMLLIIRQAACNNQRQG